MSSKRETPAQSLARMITARMAKEKLLDPARADRFSFSLAAGKLKDSDWRLEIESAPRVTKTPRKK